MKIPLLCGLLLLPLWLCAQSDSVFRMEVDQPEPLHPGQRVCLSYVSSAPMEEFTPPDLSGLELLTGMAKGEGSSTTFKNGARTQKNYYSRSWILAVPQADSVVFPGAQAVVGGQRCVCAPRSLQIIPIEVDPAEVRCSIEVLPENPDPGKPFRISVWLSDKPDKGRPEIDLSAYGSKLRVLSTGMTQRSDLIEYSYTLMAWIAGVYEIPPMTVHFGGAPFRIEGVTVRVGQSQK